MKAVLSGINTHEARSKAAISMLLLASLPFVLALDSACGGGKKNRSTNDVAPADVAPPAPSDAGLTAGDAEDIGDGSLHSPTDALDSLDAPGVGDGIAANDISNVADGDTDTPAAPETTDASDADHDCSCDDGPCCDGCNLLPQGTVCAASLLTEHGCPWGIRCGSHVGVRTADAVCSGLSAACDRENIVWNEWFESEHCAAPQGCVPGEAACADTNTCPAAPCPDAHCPSIDGRAGDCNPETGRCEYDLSYGAGGPVGRWVLAPSGEFRRGMPDDGPCPCAFSRPVHAVALTRPFLIAATELTQPQWKALVPDNPAVYEGDDGDERPVENITWWAAVHFANLLSAAAGLEPCYKLAGCTGSPGSHAGGVFQCEGGSLQSLDCPGYRLPTEAEWEYACRAGTQTVLYNGDLQSEDLCDAPEADEIAWYGGNTIFSLGRECRNPADCCGSCGHCWEDERLTCCMHHTVGEKRPNRWGLYDMAGNVLEMTGDGWHDGYDLEPPPDVPRVDPWNPPVPSVTRQFRRRGGSFNVSACGVSCAWSSGVGQANPSSHDGFRLVRSLP